MLQGSLRHCVRLSRGVTPLSHVKSIDNLIDLVRSVNLTDYQELSDIVLILHFDWDCQISKDTDLCIYITNI